MCAGGYTGAASSVVCQANATWSSATGCSRTCGAYVPPAGYVENICSGVLVGDVCDLSCVLGYQGSASDVTCLANGKWTLAEGCVNLTCLFLI